MLNVMTLIRFPRGWEVGPPFEMKLQWLDFNCVTVVNLFYLLNFLQGKWDVGPLSGMDVLQQNFVKVLYFLLYLLA